MTAFLQNYLQTYLQTVRQAIYGLGRRSAAWMFALMCLIGAARMVVYQSGQIRVLEEAGNGDLYVYGTIDKYLKTGELYPDLTKVGSQVASYSPMLYYFLALPTRLFPSENKYLPARTAELLVFLGCVVLVGSIARKLVPSRLAMPLTMIFALSYGIIFLWPGLLRGDFPAIFCSLAAMRLLLSRNRRLVILAGLIAGFETQFKITMVTAEVSGFLWLAWRREWKALALFSVGAMLTSAGLYRFFHWREPHMFQHWAGFGHPVVDVKGAIDLLKYVFREPVLLLSLAMLTIALLRWPRRFLLPAIYFAVSFTMAASTLLQIGADTNYFYEAVLALTPLALLGWLHLRWKVDAPAALFMAFMLFTIYVLPDLHTFPTLVKAATTGVSKRNRDDIALQGALKGKRVLSMVANAANFTPQGELVDPGGWAMAERMIPGSSMWIANRVASREFDLVIVPAEATFWRGMPIITPSTRAAIQEYYQPYCLFGPWLFFLPTALPKDTELTGRLDAIGGVRVNCPVDRECTSW